MRVVEGLVRHLLLIPRGAEHTQITLQVLRDDPRGNWELNTELTLHLFKYTDGVFAGILPTKDNSHALCVHVFHIFILGTGIAFAGMLRSMGSR